MDVILVQPVASLPGQSGAVVVLRGLERLEVDQAGLHDAPPLRRKPAVDEVLHVVLLQGSGAIRIVLLSSDPAPHPEVAMEVVLRLEVVVAVREQRGHVALLREDGGHASIFFGQRLPGTIRKRPLPGHPLGAHRNGRECLRIAVVEDHAFPCQPVYVRCLGGARVSCVEAHVILPQRVCDDEDDVHWKSPVRARIACNTRSGVIGNSSIRTPIAS